MQNIIEMAQDWADAAATAGDTAAHDIALVAIHGSLSRGWWQELYSREPDPAAVGLSKHEAQSLVREWQADYEAQAQGGE